MNLYKRIIEIINLSLIQYLIPIILTLIVIEFVFKRRFETKKVLNLVCWLIISYSVITWTYSLIEMIFYPKEFTFMQRATGAYEWEYWIMFLSTLILPCTLFIKKVSSNFYYVLFIAIFIKIELYFERFVIIVTSYQTSYHKDYRTETHHVELINLFLFGVLILFVQGIIIAIISLGVFEVIKKTKSKGFINGL